MAASRTVAVPKQALIFLAPGRQPSALGRGGDRRIENRLDATP
jgi:hypothetical protein